jgi:hypothetical protein
LPNSTLKIEIDKSKVLPIGGKPVIDWVDKADLNRSRQDYYQSQRSLCDSD